MSSSSDAQGGGSGPDGRRARLEMDALGPRFAAFVAGLTRPLVFIDIESTGTDPATDRIIELCLVRVSVEGGVDAPRTWRVQPGIRIPAESTRVHGISNADVAKAPVFAEIADEVLRVLDGADLAGFNVARFDLKLLHAEFLRLRKALPLDRIRVVDAQVIYHRREPRNLEAALRFYRGRELPDAHGAEPDTIASLEVFAGQLERYADLPTEVDALHDLTVAQNDGYCDSGRRFMWRDDEPAFNFGRHKGKALRLLAADPESRSYLRWFLDGDFEEDAKSIVRDALAGKIRTRAPR